MTRYFPKYMHFLLHIHLYLQPFDAVFRLLFDELDAFQDIGDIIDAPLWGIELLGNYI